MPALITPELVALDADLGADKGDVIRRLADLVADAGRATGAGALAADAMAREAQAATGLPGGIAIPHCRSAAVTEASLGLRPARPRRSTSARRTARPTWSSSSPRPRDGDADHLTLLTALARALVRPEFVASLRAAPLRGGDRRAGRGRRRPRARGRARPPPPPAAAAAAGRRPPRRRRSLVAVTACPTGIAHTYMAADELEPPPARRGRRHARRDAGLVRLHAAGPGGRSAAADAVIFAVDVGVRDQGRFAGKPVVASGVKRAINEPDAMIARGAAPPPTTRTPAGCPGGARRSPAAAGRGGGAEHRRRRSAAGC